MLATSDPSHGVTDPRLRRIEALTGYALAAQECSISMRWTDGRAMGEGEAGGIERERKLKWSDNLAL